MRLFEEKISEKIALTNFTAVISLVKGIIDLWTKISFQMSPILPRYDNLVPCSQFCEPGYFDSEKNQVKINSLYLFLILR